MLTLPPSSSPLRSLFDVESLAEMAAPSNRSKLRMLRDAVSSARQYLACESAAKEVNFVCLSADGTLQLVSVGKRGAVKRLWNFGAI